MNMDRGVNDGDKYSALGQEICSLSCLGHCLNSMFLAEASAHSLHNASKSVNHLRRLAVLCRRHSREEVVVGVNRTAAKSKPQGSITIAYRTSHPIIDIDMDMLKLCESLTSRSFEVLSRYRLSTYLGQKEKSIRGIEQHVAIVERLYRQYFLAKRSQRPKIRSVFINYTMISTFKDQLRRLRFGKEQTKFMEFLKSPPPTLCDQGPIEGVSFDCGQWADIGSGLRKTALQIGSDMYQVRMSHDGDFSRSFHQTYARARLDAEMRTLSPALLEFIHVAIGIRTQWLMESAEYLQQYRSRQQNTSTAGTWESFGPDWKAVRRLPFPYAAKRLAYAVNQLWPLWSAYTDILDQMTDVCVAVDMIPHFTTRIGSSDTSKVSGSSGVTTENIAASEKDDKNSRPSSAPLQQAPSRTAQPPAASNIQEGQHSRELASSSTSAKSCPPKPRIMFDNIARKIKYELKWGSALCNWIMWISDHADSALDVLFWQRGHQNMRLMPPIEVYVSRDFERQPPTSTSGLPSHTETLRNLIKSMKDPDSPAWTSSINRDFERASHCPQLRTVVDDLQGRCGVSVPLEVELILKFVRESFHPRPGFRRSAYPLLASPSTIPFNSALMLDVLVEEVWGGPAPRKDVVRTVLPETPSKDPNGMEITETVPGSQQERSPNLKSEAVGRVSRSDAKSPELKRRRFNCDGPSEEPKAVPKKRRPVGWMADVSVRSEIRPMALPSETNVEMRALVEDAGRVVLDQLKTEMTKRLAGGRDEWEAFEMHLNRLDSA